MVTIENECYLRSILLLKVVGRNITKKIILRETSKKSCTLDDLLIDEKFVKKVKHECKHKDQEKILYPSDGKTDVDKWDIQMLTGIIKILFKNDLKSDELKSLREIKRLRTQLAHSPSASLTSEDYTDFVTDLDSYIATLVSYFQESVKDEFSELFKEYKSCPLEVKSTLEDIKKLKDTDDLVSRIVDEIEKIETNLMKKIQETSNITLTLKADINAVLGIVQKLQQNGPFQKVRSVVNLRLTFSGEESAVNLADKILAEVIKAAIKRAKNKDSINDVEQAVDDILKEVVKIEGAKVLSAEPECVLIKVQCDTKKSLYDVLAYTTSKEYKEKLDSLTEKLTSHCNAKNLLVVCTDIHVSIDCWQLFDKSTEETKAKQESRLAERLIQFETRKEVETVVEHFDALCDTLSRKLEEMHDLTSKMKEKKLNLTSSVQNTSIVTVKGLVADGERRNSLSHAQIEETPESNPKDKLKSYVDYEKTKLVVAAIDIGNTFIANAYSYGHDFQRDHLEVHIYQDMKNSIDIKPLKTPTVALFDDKNVFHSFGYEAEVKYAQLLEDAADERIQCHWRFFSDLSLNYQLNEKYVLEDDRKQTMSALDVYVAILKCQKGKISNYLLSRINGLNESDIHWILPVPLSNSERQFFIHAAEKACFPQSRLAVLPKPKAAVIYCKELISSNYTGYFKRHLIPGEKILVVDAGCHTLSVSAHRIMSDGSIDDLESFSKIDVSGAGCLVDDNLKVLIKETFGADVLERFRQECKIDALELNDSIEMMKLQFKDPENEKTDFSYWLNIPSNLFETFKTMNGYKLSERRRREDQTVLIPTKGNKIYISNEEVIYFFKELKLHLIRKLREILKDERLRDVKTMVFVGGLSDSEILRNELRHSFPMKTIIFPDKASTAIVKGAVIYGHTTDAFF